MRNVFLTELPVVAVCLSLPNNASILTATLQLMLAYCYVRYCSVNLNYSSVTINTILGGTVTSDTRLMRMYFEMIFAFEMFCNT